MTWGRPQSRWRIMARRWAPVGVVITTTGCSEPPAITTNAGLVPEEKELLDQGDQSEVLAAMRLIAADRQPSASPTAAPAGVRWSDVLQAVQLACDEPGVEMMIVRFTESDTSFEFELRTIESRPARLHVVRVDEDHIYEASAVVGWFKDDNERAQRLLDALDWAMRAFGAKRAFDED